MDVDVYDELVQDLIDNVALDRGQAEEVVEFLWSNDFIDFDTLKEIYLYEQE